MTVPTFLHYDLSGGIFTAESAAVKKVRELAEPLCDELGLFLWDVKFEKEGGNRYLRVYIDKDGGISIEDCEALHRPLDRLLDEYDPIPESYVFEVCSPGLGRRLERPEHFEVCIGDEVKIGFFSPKNCEKEIIRTLVGFGGKEIAVSGPNGEENIPLSECAFVKLYDDGDLFSEL